MNAIKDIANFGQVFTPAVIVDAMLALRRNHGRTLEPSAGDGAFSSRIADCIAIEPDPRHAPANAIIGDFFTYPEHERFATIIGNPPYVRFQDIRPETAKHLKSALFDARSNLYLFFVEKAVRHLDPGGELIFITPRDFLKTTSSVKLNRWLLEQGNITDAIELGDTKVFSGAVPNCLIWRFEKNCVSRETRYCIIGSSDNLSSALCSPCWETRFCQEIAGHIIFAKQATNLRLSDICFVRVGAVSGADGLFASLPGNRDFVCSETVSTGQTRRMLWQAPGSSEPDPALLPHKERLLARRIRAFTENSWWQWGRACPETDAPRIYVNGRTRRPQPFFLHPCPYYDGAVLALFPHNPNINLLALTDALNGIDWAESNFVCDGRFIFTQRSLENAPLPATFAAFVSAAE